MRRGLLCAVALVALALPASLPAADTSPEQQLADKYAPIVSLKEQTAPCDSKGEPYRPVAADVVLGRADVKLLDAEGKLVAEAPTAAVLFGKGEDNYLDFPGSPLNAGCSYEQWVDGITQGKPTVSYAHVVTEPGKPGQLALQYWFYYPFNDWNNKHESDWEMIQLMFDAGSASEALSHDPVEVGYSQHSGGERAAWTASKLEKDGNHPIVYPGAGSHANYFASAVWLGHSAEEGFGCDNTTGPTRRVQTEAILLPAAAPASADAPFAWLGYDGHWGQKANGPNTGPTGPNAKTQWTQPVTWAQDTWRDASSEVPLTDTAGTSATSFFCGAVAAGSNLYLRFLRTPWFVLGLLSAIVLFGIWLSRRTHWRPAPTTPLDRTRSGGEILNAGRALYRRYLPLFLGIGVIFIPLSIATAILQKVVFDFTGLGTFVSVAENDRIISGSVALLFGAFSTAVASVLVTAACANALDAIDDGTQPDALDAYRGIVPHLGALAWAWLRIICVAVLLAVTVIGIPIAVVYLVRKVVVTQTCVIEDRGATSSLRRSSALVNRRIPRVLVIAACINVTAALLGPIVGVLILFLSSSSLGFINIVSSLVYAVVMPYAGIAIALLFYDLRARSAESAAVPPLGTVAEGAS